MNRQERSHIIKSESAKIGFHFCGISKAEKLDNEARQLEEWLHKGLHGKMQYMENHFDKRIDPAQLVPGALSVISLMYNYYPDKKQTDDAGFKIAKYAYGEDYHFVIKDKLKTLLHILQEKIGQFQARIFVDSAPVLEKVWAKKSGLGWQGKNTNLIHPKAGSFFFLAEIICDLELEPDGPMKDYCGSCTACLDACPTDALYQPYQIDASRCISYLTIELKENIIPDKFQDKMENWMFGCDICQDVCPWNRFSKPHSESRFIPAEELFTMQQDDWENISEKTFAHLFGKSAVQRTKYSGLKRNIHFIAKQND